MARFMGLSLLLFYAQAIHAIIVNSSQPITVEIKFADATARGVLNFATQTCYSQTTSPYYSISTPSPKPPFVNATTSMVQLPTPVNQTMTITDFRKTEQPQATNILPSSISRPILSIVTIPTINLTNSSNSSLSSPGVVFTSGSPQGRSGLIRLIESLWAMNR
ncbi:hypothetical protein GE09DRAFT_1161623 [Coniochaeta sp. 2T2.1]|nr:hypothetical protein GE09DRAFT_1161623 [Coniochaeta sp. 2T2.1]